LLLPLLLLTVREPIRRQGDERGPTSAQTRPSLLGYVVLHRRAFGAAIPAYVLVVYVMYTLVGWTPTLLSRTYGITPAEAGHTYGLVLIGLAPISSIGGGYFADWLVRRHPDGRFRVQLVFAPLMIPGLLAFTLAPTLAGSIVGLAVVTVAGTIISSTVYTAVQEMAPGLLRGQMLAVYGLCVNLVGVALGPMLVALSTDYLFHDRAQVRWSLLLATLPALFIAIALGWFGLKPFRQTVLAANR
jgi:sugar phosphate permease